MDLEAPPVPRQAEKPRYVSRPGLVHGQSLLLCKAPADCLTQRLQMTAPDVRGDRQCGSSRCSKHIVQACWETVSPNPSSTRCNQAASRQSEHRMLPWWPSIEGISMAHVGRSQKSQRMSSGCTFSVSHPSRCMDQRLTRVAALKGRPSRRYFRSKLVPTTSPSPADAGGRNSMTSKRSLQRSKCCRYHSHRPS